jgi:ABC-2 type transport system ATP-binding protein
VAENIIELTGLTRKYGSFTAVDHLNLTIRKGEIFGLLGPNGAGKSTTILMMLGLTDPISGTASVCGIDPLTNALEVKKRVGYLPEDIGFYDNMTGLENLIYTARLNRIAGKEAVERARALLSRVGLSDDADKKAGKYSRGMRQRLGLADVLIKNPEVIILDEPTLGIDPTGVKDFLNLIVELSREHGITVLFSSHDLHQVQKVCDRVGLFVGGKLLAEGDIQTLSRTLISSSPYLIEVGISHPEAIDIDQAAEEYTTAWLKKILQPVEGVIDVSGSNGIYQIGCSHDITTEIARAIIESGAGLTYLNRKEYGLDDIYYRYFEGEKENDKNSDTDI